MIKLFPGVVALIFLFLHLHQPTVSSTKNDPTDPFAGIANVIDGMSHDLVVAFFLAALIFAGFYGVKIVLENWTGR